MSLLKFMFFEGIILKFFLRVCHFKQSLILLIGLYPQVSDPDLGLTDLLIHLELPFSSRLQFPSEFQLFSSSARRSLLYSSHRLP